MEFYKTGKAVTDNTVIVQLENWHLVPAWNFDYFGTKWAGCVRARGFCKQLSPDGASTLCTFCAVVKSEDVISRPNGG